VIEIRFAKPRQDADAARFEKGRHRRIDVLVAAGDGATEFAAHRGDGRHRGAANPHKMDGVDLLLQHL